MGDPRIIRQYLLFTRAHKRVTLTPQGEALFQLTKQFFSAEVLIGEYLSEARSAVHGTLRIIADSAHHVTGILTRLRARYPDAVVTLRTGNTDEVLGAQRSYDAEIGVAGSLSLGRDMDTVALGATEITGFAARGLLLAGKRPLLLKELADCPLIFREEG